MLYATNVVAGCHDWLLAVFRPYDDRRHITVIECHLQSS